MESHYSGGAEEPVWHQLSQQITPDYYTASLEVSLFSVTAPFISQWHLQGHGEEAPKTTRIRWSPEEEGKISVCKEGGADTYSTANVLLV